MVDDGGDCMSTLNTNHGRGGLAHEATRAANPPPRIFGAEAASQPRTLKLKNLGAGASGTVELGLHPDTRELVVVKWLRAGLALDAGSAERFRREAALLGDNELEGISMVRDHGQDVAGRIWMKMGFLDGVNPADHIRRGDVRAIHRLLEGLGTSLDALHRRGIVHRDVKPDNIILSGPSAAWRPTLIDFGVAKWLGLEAATATGSLLGTPNYMSPEQFEDSKRVGPAVDLYGLAVVAYQLLAGRLPFGGASLFALLEQHMSRPVPAVPFRRDKDDPDETVDTARSVPHVDAFMRRALAKNPEERYGSGAEMADAFRAAAQADDIWKDSPSPRPLFRATGSPRVEFIAPGGQNTIVDTTQGPAIIGRSTSNDLSVDSRTMSRHHLCVYRAGGQVWLAELGSRNGTAVDDRALVQGRPVSLTGSHCVRAGGVPISVRLLPTD